MKAGIVDEEKRPVVGWDIGGAHLKMSRTENGAVTFATTVRASMWLGIDQVREALAGLRPLFESGATHVFTMTGELSDGFPSRRSGIRGILDFIAAEFASRDVRIYAGRAGFVDLARAYDLGCDIASANWHATAALSASVKGEGLFVDMGSTTTDIIPFKDGRLCNAGYTDAERLMSGELVYTGATRSALIGIAERVPVRGLMTPLMNEYFANTADVGRILGTLEEADDHYPAADRREKSRDGSIARLARMVGRDGADLDEQEWVGVARWFSEHQLRMIHDGALLADANARLASHAPVIGAGIGRPQIARLAERMGRPYVDFGTLIPAVDTAREEASKAAPAAAVALLWAAA